MLKRISIVIGFVRRLIPKEGRSVRFYLSLLNLFVGSRQSIYQHYRQLKTSHRNSRIQDFLRELAAASVSGRASVPAALLARLVRTIYLTELGAREHGDPRYGGPNAGYIDHPHFSYGHSLSAKTKQGDASQA